MLSKRKTKGKIILLDPDITIEPTTKQLHVILSPALYWVRRFKLPTTSQREAKKILPSLFEEFLPPGDFSYYGYFNNENFIGFAYEQQAIRTLLQAKGLDAARIVSLHFAQIELDASKLPMRLSSSWMLDSIDGIILKLPSTKQQLKQPNLQELTLSKHSIKIERYDTLIKKSTLAMLCAIAIGFGLLWVVQWYKLHLAKQQLQERLDGLYKRYNLLPTTTQNKSLLKRYEKINSKQKRLRKALRILLETPRKSGGHLESIRLEGAAIKALFKDIKEPNKALKRLEGFGVKSKKLDEQTLLVEVAL